MTDIVPATPPKVALAKSTPLGNKITKTQGRGYWEIAVTPPRMLRLNVAEAEQCIREAALPFRGWSFPMLARTGLHRTHDSVGFDVDYRYMKESWVYSTDGVFVHLLGFVEDWQDEDPRHLPGTGIDFAPGAALSLNNLVAHVTEVIRFCCRFAPWQSVGQVTAHIGLHGLQNRVIFNPQSGAQIRTNLPSLTRSVQVQTRSSAELAEALISQIVVDLTSSLGLAISERDVKIALASLQ